jgi:hypothetical protein
MRNYKDEIKEIDRRHDRTMRLAVGYCERAKVAEQISKKNIPHHMRIFWINVAKKLVARGKVIATDHQDFLATVKGSM